MVRGEMCGPWRGQWRLGVEVVSGGVCVGGEVCVEECVERCARRVVQGCVDVCVCEVCSVSHRQLTRVYIESACSFFQSLHDECTSWRKVHGASSHHNCRRRHHTPKPHLDWSSPSVTRNIRISSHSTSAANHPPPTPTRQ